MSNNLSAKELRLLKDLVGEKITLNLIDGDEKVDENKFKELVELNKKLATIIGR